jgi:glucoside 3-dehydrogenase (cytochrome c) hitch-hiker subunit
MEHDDLITRRAALGRVALLLGGAISAPTLAGALDAATRGAWIPAPQDWAPRTLTAGQLELVAVMADHIIPQTDTPGARAAGVHRFVDTLLSDHYPGPERDRFLAGLADVDARTQARHGTAFLDCTAEQQLALLTELDEAAYPVASDAPRPPEAWFFHRMKELTLVGYYTSQIGATQELHPSPFGAYRGDIPYASVGRAWS